MSWAMKWVQLLKEGQYKKMHFVDAIKILSLILDSIHALFNRTPARGTKAMTA